MHYYFPRKVLIHTSPDLYLSIPLIDRHQLLINTCVFIDTARGVRGGAPDYNVFIDTCIDRYLYVSIPVLIDTSY